MSLTCTVGGARGTFDEALAAEVAGVLDHAFGAEGDWEGTAPRKFGELPAGTWAEFQERAVAELGAENVPNLLALDDQGRGVYLPANVQAVSLPLRAGKSLRCASLPGLRRELAELAQKWGLPADDDGLLDILRVELDPDDGFVADAPEVRRLLASPSPPTRRSAAIARCGWSAID